MAVTTNIPSDHWPLYVSEDFARRLGETVRKVERLQGNGVVNTSSGISINPVFPRQRVTPQINRHHPLKVTGRFSSSSVGVYTCDAFLVGDIETAQNETMEEADLGEKKSAAGIIFHLAEIAGYGAPLIAGQYVGGRFALMSQADEMTFIVDNAGLTSVQVKITGNATGGGKYVGRLVKGSSTANDIDNLTEADLGTASGSEDCLILNRREVGSAGHDLEATGYLPVVFDGRPIGYTTDGKLIVTIDGGQQEDC